MVKFSIIIPAHQEEQYIEKCLKSVNFPDTEVIVVANGCTDKTAKIAMNYCKVLEIKEKNVSLARNIGAREASGEKLIFLDADVLMTKGLLDKFNNCNYNVASCLVKPDVPKLFPKFLMLLKTLTHYLGFSSGLIFCEKDLFEKVGGFDENRCVGEDGDLLRKAKAYGKFGVVNGYVVNSMRRFEKTGYFKNMWFWIKHFFKKINNYEVVR